MFCFFSWLCASDCGTSKNGVFYNKLELTSSDCIIVHNCVFLSTAGAISCTSQCTVTICDSFLVYCTAAEIYLEGPTELTYSRNQILCKWNRFRAIEIATTGSPMVNTNFSSFLMIWREGSICTSSGGTSTSNVNFSQCGNNDDTVHDNTFGYTFYITAGDSCSIKQTTIANIKSNLGYIFRIDNINGMVVEDTNFYNLQSTDKEPLRMVNVIGTFTRCCFIKGGNSKSDWQYSSGFTNSAFSDCVCSDISYNANDIVSKVGSSGGRTTIPITHFKTWYMDADIPYHEATTPARTLPTPCPPVPPQKQPRKIKRVITTASNSLVPIVTEFM